MACQVKMMNKKYFKVGCSSSTKFFIHDIVQEADWRSQPGVCRHARPCASRGCDLCCYSQIQTCSSVPPFANYSNSTFVQVTMDPQWQQKIEQDIKEAQDTALPEDDEDL